MADDLSRSNQRRNAQDRVTENRDAIAPTRRETRVADAQVRSDTRASAVLKEKTDKELIDNTVSNAVAGLTRGDAVSLSAERARLTQAENEFERRLANGEDPMQAADAVVRNYGNSLCIFGKAGCPASAATPPDRRASAKRS